MYTAGEDRLRNSGVHLYLVCYDENCKIQSHDYVPEGFLKYEYVSFCDDRISERCLF